ncbi:disease resistance protein RGA2-like isoform X2 [Magnolia sinica]|uniref:disease resistance protein RGA2-like isoform X2 n=1 Tax=Magnolia sinica TaxID=86752 RepID=UPI0026583FF8|nr:disease resistance protein RGA2-like isoform X2 [Magnolia sinica]
MVDSLVSLAKEKLTKVLEDEAVLLVGVTNEIENLSITFNLLQAVLKDAETQRVKNEAVKKWLENLKDVAYDVDDILDEWTTDALRPQAPDEGDGSCFSFLVTCYLSCVTFFNHVALRHKIGSRIKEVKGRLDVIEKAKNQLGLKVDSEKMERVNGEVRPAEIRERETASLLDRPSVFGREDDKNRVVDLLLGESSGEVNEVPFVVISIVGMGGLGKTTLAQLAYNDEKVMEHFQMIMWVCVSEDFDVKRITKSIIQSATKTGCDSLDLDQLQCRLREMLHAKRFLLVLDDIWSEEPDKWDRLKLPFQAGAAGSRILITTRKEKVASAMGRARVCNLEVLSHADCWLVFWHRALEHRSAEERSKLEDIGREIVKKCGGLPLAAKTIGSAMWSRRTRREWELVLESDIWNLDDVLQGVLPALLLSYHDLRPALKQCFAYFSIFPKDWEIKKDMTVKLWVAQGFIPSNGSRDMEETGSQYFDDLLGRSLLQDAELDDDKNIVECKMHDLVHDLAKSVAGSECSLVDIREQASLNPSNLRHSFLNVSDEEVASIWPTLYKANKLRTLLCYPIIYKPRVPNNLFNHFRHLRALDLSDTSIQKLPGTVGKLKQLRYLDLSRTHIKKLPEGVGKLKQLIYLDLSLTNIKELPEGVSNCVNLQTLKLQYCHQLKKLPKGLGKMINLRHLDLEGTRQLKYLPQGIGRLSSLRTITKLIVEGGIEGCKWGEVKQLINHLHLQGRLQIIGLEKVKSRDEAREAELYKLQDIYDISYEYRGDEALDDDEVKRMEEVLEILKPHTNLKELEIRGYEGWKLPKWIEDPVFFNLVEVILSSCSKCKQLPGLGKLPSLKCLEIVGMEEMRKVGGEFSGDDNNDGSGGVVSFPKLETLFFEDMLNWEEWELIGDGEVMLSLLELEIRNCPKLKELPSNLPPRLQKLSLRIGNDGLPSGGPLPILPNLHHLEVVGSDELTSFPCGWLGQLKALQTLKINNCSNLRSLPAEELKHLTMLQQLTIWWCPLLKARYRVGGEDRDKIAHIPNISIE